MMATMRYRRPRRTYRAPNEIRAPRLRRIALAAESVANSQAGVEEAVAAAREAGNSWAMIGTALGVSRQAAFQRFRKVAP